MRKRKPRFFAKIWICKERVTNIRHASAPNFDSKYRSVLGFERTDGVDLKVKTKKVIKEKN